MRIRGLGGGGGGGGVVQDIGGSWRCFTTGGGRGPEIDGESAWVKRRCEAEDGLEIAMLSSTSCRWHSRGAISLASFPGFPLVLRPIAT